MSADLQDRVALVTGAGSGIGRAVALILADRGAVVAVNDLNEEAAAKVAAECPSGRALTVAFDVRDRAAVDAAVAGIVEMHQTVDILVNCAGIGPAPTAADIGPAVLSLDDESWADMFESHVYGAFYCCRAVLGHMCRQGRGSIVNLSSIAAIYGGQALHYSAAKSAMLGFTKTLSHDVGAHGVRVNAVAPGFVDTPMIGIGRATVESLVATRFDTGRMAAPTEIAEIIAFLVSDRGAACSGEVIEASGGLRWM